MSQAELLHWCSAHHAAPATDEESEIVAQFLAAPYPYQDDDDEQDQKHLGDIRASSTYWPDQVTDPSAGAGYWPSSGESSSINRNSGGGGGYFDVDDGCYYYLGEPDVSLGINTLTLPCTSIDLNLLGDGEEERSACVHPLLPNPSPADHIRTGHLRGGNEGATARASASQPQPKRKVQAGRDGGDLGLYKKKARASNKVRNYANLFLEVGDHGELELASCNL
ncbi:uncharacterized protein LOC133910781 [Phragmites australis]|uniref:uncharacterized protein LOC133910781 n=1 Tax=Phragmites australis TaxID=29695 RepID=UPI002D77E9D1|nr:uncharacterized protein LOC133910781 [Phragmites australis]